MATVTLERIFKTYKSRRRQVCAVEDLSLTVADQEFVVLVGPSGCGKTTTLRLVAGLEEADAGKIWIGERLVNDVPPKDRDIAMVFQNYALYPHMTVSGNLGFGLKMRRVPRAEVKQRVCDVAGLLGIEHLLDRKPAALSGGERQRVAVGRAIVRRPQVFLFDEPLSNLDAKLRLHMRTELKALHQKLQATIIYVTHDQEEAMTLGDHLVIMKDGVVQQCGTPLDVYNQPVNQFVAGFIGTPTMNFLRGRLGREADLVHFEGLSARLVFPPTRASALESQVGASVVLGVRAEHLRLDGNGAAGGAAAVDRHADHSARVQAQISVVEPLGDSINVHLVLGHGESIVARVPPTVQLAPGQSRDLIIDMTYAHVFADDEGGRRLC